MVFEEIIYFDEVENIEVGKTNFVVVNKDFVVILKIFVIDVEQDSMVDDDYHKVDLIELGIIKS